MAFNSITKPSVGDATKKQSFADLVIDNLIYLYNNLVGSDSIEGVPNSSFENDLDANGVPDQWDWTSSGGTISIDDTLGNQKHGSKAVKITSTGAGGGFIQSTDMVPCSDTRRITFQFAMKVSSATVACKFAVVYYNRVRSFVSEVTLFNSSTGNPTSWGYKTFLTPTPPVGACFFKLKFYGANSAVAGSTWYDDFRIIQTDLNNVSANIQAFTANGTFTVPDWVSRVRVRCWGGGGGGGGYSTINGDGGGGGGGAYAEDIIAVVSGESLTVTIGAGGAGGAGGVTAFDGAAGAATTLKRSATTLVSAGGGALGGGDPSTRAGGNGGTSSATLNLSGGKGQGGGQGGTGGGAGGGGGARGHVNAINGVSPGGGAGGGKSGTTGGGDGADGRLIIEY